MNPYIRITRKPYEEPYHLNLLLEIGNTTTQAGFEVYANRTDLSELASALAGFPKDDMDQVLLELGSESQEWHSYFRCRIFQVAPSGKCAVELRFNNNQSPPEQQVAEFCIEAYPADLDRLRLDLAHFSELQDFELNWEVC